MRESKHFMLWSVFYINLERYYVTFTNSYKFYRQTSNHAYVNHAQINSWNQ